MPVVGGQEEGTAAVEVPCPAKSGRRTAWHFTLWCVGIFASLALAWFIGAVGIPFYQTQAALSSLPPKPIGRIIRVTSDEEVAENRLGGEKAALRKLALYLRLPAVVAKDKDRALRVLSSCCAPDESDATGLPMEIKMGSDSWRILVARMEARMAPDVVPGLIVSLRDPKVVVRAEAANWLWMWPEHAGSAIPALEQATRDADESVRLAATRALRRIRGEKEE